MKLKLIKLENPKYELQIRETLDGRIFVRDHPDIDIVLIPEQSKLVTFPKEEMNDYVYGSQDILFNYLVKRGMILPESIQGGSVYFSIEGTIPESLTKVNPIDATLMNIAEFLQQEQAYFDAEENYKKDLEKAQYAPDEDESTNFGEVPHAEKKGSIPKSRPVNFGGGFGATYE